MSIFGKPGGSAILSAITGFGTGIATALGINVGTDGAPVIKGGDLGTPSAGVGTNLTGTASGLTAGVATLANGLKSATTTVAVSSATAPSSGQVLTATSSTAATWQDAGGGGDMVLLSSQTASASTFLNFTLTGGYTSYVVVGQGLVPSADASWVGAQVSLNSGSSYDSGGSDYRMSQAEMYGSTTLNSASTGAYMKIGTTAGNAAGEILSFRLDLVNTGGFCAFGTTTYLSQNDDFMNGRVAYKRSSTTAATNIRFGGWLMDGATSITSGTISLYGLT